jgi:glutathione S-transferase
LKLYYSATSPYVRKVIACAVACGTLDQITRIETNPHTSPPDLLADNPLSKVPCLVTQDGFALFDSPVICEYLDAVGAGSLFPPPGPARWRALKWQAIGDGIMDAAVSRRMDMARPPEAARDASMARQQAAITRALDLLQADPPANHLDIGSITIACALGYLDFRFAADAWREGRGKLAQWYAVMEQRPEIAQSAPPREAA